MRLVIAIVLALILAGGAFFFMSGAPSAPTIAKENPCDLFSSLDGALAQFMREQRDAQPGLTCEHFEQVSDSTPTVEPATYWQDADGVLGRSLERWRSPDKNRMLLPASDNLSVIDLTSSMRRILLTSSSGESWTDAGWMDAQAFVAAGIATGPTPGMQAPTLTVFRLDSNRVSVFRGPASPAR